MFEAFLVVFAIVLFTILTLMTRWYLRFPVDSLRDRAVVTPLAWVPEEKMDVGLSVESRTSLEELPGFITLLLILHEDDLFFVHRGVNWREVSARLKAYVVGRAPLHGGSSITQQLAKHLFSPNRRPGRFRRMQEKFRELLCAYKLERAFSKTEIASLYISSIRLGAGPVFGLRAASDLYFCKPPRDLELHEALFLMGIIPAPSTFVFRLLVEGNSSPFLIKTAFVKCVDLMRMLVLSFGWRTLDSIHELSLRDVIAVALDMKRYDPRRLSPEFELVLEARAMLVIEKLETMLRQMTRHPHPDLGRYRGELRAAQA